MGNKLKKVFAAILASAIIFAMVLTGTYAWQSISQQAENEDAGTSNPGGRLHDDFDGRNKDVYVENFTDPETGADIFARIRLDEYMEIGAGAGLVDGEDGYTEKSVTILGATDGGTVPDINDPSTWITHIPAREANLCTNGAPMTFHGYWNWKMGGQTVYMPTFNKNRDSLAADINGTYTGPDDNRADDADKFTDYKPYELGDQIVDGTAVYDADTDTIDEGDTSVLNTDHTEVTETHTAQETLSARVMTMERWILEGSKPGPYWVYDVDGWAYWAQAIEPGTATGLLLDGIELETDPGDEWYYAINVVAQFATAGDWFTEEDGGEPSEDALLLLNQAAGRLPRVTGIYINEGIQAYAKVGESLTLTADVTVMYSLGEPGETLVNWSIEPATSTFFGGIFTPSASMAGQTFTVTATSALDPTYYTTIDVIVYPADASEVVEGETDGKMYVGYPDNTYKVIGEDGTISDEFISAGQDEIIGNADDRYPVEFTGEETGYGTKFLGPDDGGYYWAMGDDGKLGTKDDIPVLGKPWPDYIYEPIATEIEISVAGNASSVRQGKTVSLSAVVKLAGTAVADEHQGVTWSMVPSVAVQSGTSIDSATGELTVDVYETVGNELTITAASTAQDGLVARIKLTVSEWTVPARIRSVAVNSSDTVPIDGYDWYVLKNEGDKALLWCAEVVHTSQFNPDGTNNQWEGSTAQTYLNDDFYNNMLPTMKPYIQETSLTTLQFGTTTFIPSTDHIFLLSEADVFGTYKNTATTEGQHYTYAGQQLITNTDMLISKPTAVGYWLRSPVNTANGAALVNITGTLVNQNIRDSYGLRPAMWVNLGS